MELQINALIQAMSVMKIKSDSVFMLSPSGKLVLSDNLKTAPVGYTGKPAYFNAKLFCDAVKMAAKQGCQSIRLDTPVENKGVAVEFIGLAKTHFVKPLHCKNLFSEYSELEADHRVEVFLSRDDIRGMTAHTDKDRDNYPGLILSKNNVLATNGAAAIALRRRVRGLPNGEALYFNHEFTASLEKSLPSKGATRIVINLNKARNKFVALIDDIEITGTCHENRNVMAEKLPMPQHNIEYSFDLKTLKSLGKFGGAYSKIRFEGLTAYVYDPDKGELTLSFKAGFEGPSELFILDPKRLRAMIAAFPTKTKTIKMLVEALPTGAAVRFKADDERIYLLMGMKK